MTGKEIAATQLGLPQFAITPTADAQAFDLSSHKRARDALALGLAAAGGGHNAYVIGPDRAARMTATHRYLRNWVSTQSAADDWVYLFNFDNPENPKPLALPRGAGRNLQRAMLEAIPTLCNDLASAFGAENYQRQLSDMRAQVDGSLQERFQALDALARDSNLTIANTAQGMMVAALDAKGEPVAVQSLDSQDLSGAQREALRSAYVSINEQLADLNRQAAKLQEQLIESHRELNADVAKAATAATLNRLVSQVSEATPELSAWLEKFKIDLVENYELLLQQQESGALIANPAAVSTRYGVNLLVDRTATRHAPLVVEQNPTYENLFGRIEYQQTANGGLTTDASLIRAGALHQANGGVLVLRDEALASQPNLWAYLKAALRDNEVRIEEFYRAGSPPIAGAPKPLPVPLDVKVILVGSPRWFYGFFAQDPEFTTYFKLQAHIESFVEANPDNLGRYAQLIRDDAANADIELSEGALTTLLGQSARWASHRSRLSAQFELLSDLVLEAAQIARQDSATPKAALTAQQIAQAIENRRSRNSLMEDSVHRAIADGTTLIDVQGSEVGQINGLTVQSVGDHSFGTPARITARASVGRRGVVNIERDVAMSGPIQQKGILVLQGILMRRFARTFPLSFDCSITFEQLYGGVEGDSASMAEYIAIVSDLAEVPLRQDLAITGSINQLGEAQVIGGAHHKIEGFFRACETLGGLTGTQGAIIPAANEDHLVLRDDVAQAVGDGRFHVYSVTTVEEALELFTGMPVGDAEHQSDDTLYGRVRKTLNRFDKALHERGI